MSRTRENFRIVFMGTPEFAVASLKALIDNQFNVVGVVTSPDKPAGRGQKMSESAVKQYAITHHLPVLQPENLKDPGFQQQLKELNADIQVIVAFRMLPQSVWAMPPLGSVNVHGSLLPHYRGAAPINRAIMNGEKVTGITTFFLKHEIDTGDILFFEKVPIDPTDNAGTLHDKLMQTGAQVLLKTMEAILNNNYTEIPQNKLLLPGETIKTAPKIFKEDCRINWSRPCNEIINHIRGLSPYPAAFTELFKDEMEPIGMKVFHATYTEYFHSYKTGTIISDQKTYIKIAVDKGFIEIHDLQVSGKKRMLVADFLRGFKEISSYSCR